MADALKFVALMMPFNLMAAYGVWLIVDIERTIRRIESKDKK